MATLEYFVVCESAPVDASTNRVSLFNVLEDVFPDRFPDRLPRIDAVSLWNLTDSDAATDFQAVLTVRAPGLPEAEFAMNFARGRTKYRAIVGIRDIPLNEPGDLVFEIALNGHHQASHIVTIHAVGAPAVWNDYPRQ